MLLLALCGCASAQPGPCADGWDGGNPAGCPASWAEALALCGAPTACTGTLSCFYRGAGDFGSGSDACISPGVLGCGGSVDAGVWDCAQ